jgi:hypothetical protein
MAQSAPEPQPRNGWKKYLTSPIATIVVTALATLLVTPIFLQALGADISLFAREPVPAVVINAGGQGTGSSDSEVAALRAQIELMRQYDQRLVETVYWGLGTVITVAIALVGFGAFANFRLYDRDRAALQQELATALQREKDALAQELEKARRDAERSRLQAEQAQAKQMTDRFNALEKSSSERINTATIGLRREVNERHDELSSSLKEMQYDLLKQQVSEQERTLSTVGDIGGRDYILFLHFRMLGLANEIGFSFNITDTLDGIQR